MKPLTAELLQKFDYMPDNAYLDSTDLQQLLGTKCLGLHIRHGYLPAPSERHKACTPHYKARAKSGYKQPTYSSNNKKSLLANGGTKTVCQTKRRYSL